MSKEKEQGQLEIAKKIIEQGSCDNILCWEGLHGQFPGIECPFNALELAGCASEFAVQLAKDYVEEYNKNNQPESPWRPIETAPKDGTKIIVFVPRLGCNIVFYAYPGDWVDDNFHQYSPTYWIPIPELPEV